MRVLGWTDILPKLRIARTREVTSKLGRKIIKDPRVEIPSGITSELVLNRREMSQRKLELLSHQCLVSVCNFF